MTRDDIIRMAREVADKDKDDPYHAGEPPFIVLTDEELERFAALVAAREREACAKVCDEIETDNWDKYKGREYDEIIWRADAHVQGVSGGANDCAAAIRARG